MFRFFCSSVIFLMLYSHREPRVKPSRQTSCLHTTRARPAQLQRPLQGSCPTTTKPRMTQTFETAWASYWPDSSPGKVRTESRGKASHALAVSHASYFCLPISTVFLLSVSPLCSDVYFPLLPEIHPSAITRHSCCVLVPPSGISHLPLASSLLPQFFHTSFLPSDLTVLSSCRPESLFLCHVNTVRLGELLSSLVLQNTHEDNVQKQNQSAWHSSFMHWTVSTGRKNGISSHIFFPSREHLPVLIISFVSRLSIPDKILHREQSQWTLPQPQDKGQRLPRLDGLWTSQCRGVRVLLLKAWLP